MVKITQITAEFKRDIWRNESKKFIGHNKKHSFEGMAEITGLSEEYIRRVVNGDTTPCDHKGMRIGSGIESPAFINTVFLEPMGFTGARLLIPVDHCPRRMLSSMLERAATIARAIEDDDIDHQERQTLIKELDELNIHIAEFTASLKLRG
jgi:hypothetical protein